MIKLRPTRRELRSMGIEARSGKGSHEIWFDPRQPRRRVVLSGTGGSDTLKYQRCRVRRFRRGMMVYD